MTLSAYHRECGRRDSDPQVRSTGGSKPPAYAISATAAKTQPSGGRKGQPDRSAVFHLTTGGSRATIRTVPLGVRLHMTGLLARHLGYTSPGRLSSPNDLPVGAQLLRGLLLYGFLVAVCPHALSSAAAHEILQVGSIDHASHLTTLKPRGLDQFVNRDEASLQEEMWTLAYRDWREVTEPADAAGE